MYLKIEEIVPLLPFSFDVMEVNPEEMLERIEEEELYTAARILKVQEYLEDCLLQSDKEESVKKCLSILLKYQEEQTMLSKLNGAFRLYFTSKPGEPKVLKITGTQHDGKKTGLHHVYDRQGRCKALFSYRNGALQKITYYQLFEKFRQIPEVPNLILQEDEMMEEQIVKDNDMKKLHITRRVKISGNWMVWESFHIVNGKRHGTHLLNYCQEPHTGRLMVKTNFHQNFPYGPHGYVKFFWPHGVVQCSLPVRFGQVHGVCRTYSKTGRLFVESAYQHNARHGKTIHYNPRKPPADQKRPADRRPGFRRYDVKNYQRGKAHGLYIQYHSNGMVERQCRYLDGKLHGVEKFFFTDGSLKKTERWKCGVSVKHLLEQKNEMTFRLIKETQQMSLLKKLPCNFLRAELTKEDVSFRKSWGKKKLLDALLKSNVKSFTLEKEAEEQEEIDMFGNPIEIPVVGSDGGIYDEKSMIELFRKSNDKYINIRGGHYENGIWVVDFPRMNQGKPLSSYYDMETLENGTTPIENRKELMTLLKNTMQKMT
jgi:antitoxin component YwqK of YwqJK toxin-antitoxin module